MLHLIQENGISFSMKMDEISDHRSINAMKVVGCFVAENGIDDMPLNEIIEEIYKARKRYGNKEFFVCS